MKFPHSSEEKAGQPPVIFPGHNAAGGDDEAANEETS
jgi:hypothetical protein